MTITTFAFFGDSLSHGLNGGFAFYEGGQGSWFEQTMERIANTLNIPRVSSGFRPVGLAFIGPDDEITYTTGGNAWTNTASTDAWDKAPAGQSRYGTGINKVVTFKPKTTGSMSQRAVVGFSLYWVDLSNGTTIVGGNWQYRVDGGTWTNMGQTLTGNNAIKKFYVNTAVTTSVEVRCYNGTTDCYALPLAPEWFWVNPVGLASGLIGHNYAVGGKNLHDNMPAASSGDRLAVLDSVSLGTGSPPSSTPNAGVIYFGGHDAIDYSGGGASQFADDFETLYYRAKPLGKVGIVNPYEFDVALADATVQAAYRSAIVQRITASLPGGLAAANPSNPPVYLDLFDAYFNLGFGYQNAQGVNLAAAGYTTDGTHPSQFGHNDLTPRIYWWIRQQFLALGNVPSTYTATGSRAAVAYSGSRAAVAYAAGLPIGIA